MSVSNGSEPGWYADPTGIHHRRYWDGDAWTAHVADRFGGTAAHHLQEHYPPPGSAAAPAGRSGADACAGTLHRAVQRRSPAAAQARGAASSGAHAPRGARRRATGTRGTPRSWRNPRPTPEPEAPGARDADAPDDALVLAAQVLQRATEDAGFSWRESDMTIDDAINALPVDIADNTVAMMHRIFATAGDEENATWTDEKLREIKLLKRGYRRLYELVAATPREEVLAKSRAYGVPDDLTEDFVAGMLSSQIPTVAELLAARLPVDERDRV